MKDGAFRATLGASATKLRGLLQAPAERAWEIFNWPTALPLIRMSIEAGWLDRVAQSDGKDITAAQLVSPRAPDVSLISRVMRCLARVDIVDEVGIQTYAPNGMTKLFTAPGMRDGVLHINNCEATMSRMPVYFSNVQYKTPENEVDGAYTYAEGMPFFKDIAHKPQKLQAFNNSMGAVRDHKKNWFDTYPVEKLRIESDSEVLLIDIAGGLGHDLAAFNARRQPLKLSGRLILQDRAPVLADLTEERKKEIFPVEQDFFKPQPENCRDARAYYLGMIMHDWPDSMCLTILGHVRDAMKPGYSTLLINETALPEKDCPTFEAFFDILMMVICSGKERTRQNWHDLIGQVEGLEIDLAHR